MLFHCFQALGLPLTTPHILADLNFLPTIVPTVVQHSARLLPCIHTHPHFIHPSTYSRSVAHPTSSEPFNRPFLRFQQRQDPRFVGYHHPWFSRRSTACRLLSTSRIICHFPQAPLLESISCFIDKLHMSLSSCRRFGRLLPRYPSRVANAKGLPFHPAFPWPFEFTL